MTFESGFLSILQIGDSQRPDLGGGSSITVNHLVQLNNASNYVGDWILDDGGLIINSDAARRRGEHGALSERRGALQTDAAITTSRQFIGPIDVYAFVC